MRNRKRVGWHKYINGVTISTLVTVLFILLPLYWLVATSFKNPNAIGNSPPSLTPSPISGANYSNAFVGYDFGIYFRNSIIVTVCTTALVLFLGTLAGYALGRLPMRGKFTTLVVLLIISVFPAVAVLAPLYLLMREIGWLNSYQALILPYTAFNLPFAIWILRNYMLGIPKEMEETGRIDGASPLRTVWTIVLAAGPARPVHGGDLLLHRLLDRVPDGADVQQLEQLPDHPGGHRRIRRELPGPVRDHLRGQRRGGGAHRHPGLHLPQVRDLRPDLGRGEGMSKSGKHGHGPGKESAWPR